MKFIDRSKEILLLYRPMTIQELAKKMMVKASLLCEYINTLKFSKEILNINNLLEIEEIQLILEELGSKFKIKKSIQNIIQNFRNKNYSSLKKDKKIPVVSIMGHVDHGKTTLLDFLRSSNIAAIEKGSITQNIGAYNVQTEKGCITFLDTPGHETFNLMRVRGIKLSDIIIIIIAANDGIKPQTLEVREQALQFRLPIIVALNKIELVDNKIQQSITTELDLKYNIVDVIPISAKTGQGVSKLLDTVLLQRDLLELRSSQEGMVIATVIESSVDKHLGPVASIIIENGTLHKGDLVVCGNTYGKIKNIRDDSLKQIIAGYPNRPIQILGLDESPIVGDKLITVATEKVAKEIISFKDDKFNNLNYESNNLKKIHIIIKSDTSGTLEVILNYLDSLNKKYKDQILFKVIHRGIGDINDTDVLLSANTKAHLIGFNVGIDTHVQQIIRHRKIEVKIYNIIYQLMKYINNEFLIESTSKEEEKNILGIARVQTIYSKEILGCKILVGVFKKDSYIEIYREERLISKGYLESLRRFKTDVNEVRAPMECGISINVKVKDITIGDIVKSFYENK